MAALKKGVYFFGCWLPSSVKWHYIYAHELRSVYRPCFLASHYTNFLGATMPGGLLRYHFWMVLVLKLS